MAIREPASLGRLRADKHLTLHSLYAIRLWEGRLAADNVHGIFGLTGFVGMLNRIYRDASHDDPYADAWLLRVQAKLDATRNTLLLLRAQLNQALAQTPAALSLGDNLNQQPVQIPVTVSAPMGFLALFLLADYDELARRAVLAQHTALIDAPTLEHWLEQGGHQLRSLFSLVQPYRSSGICRSDCLAQNAKALRAREQFGELEQAILDGQLRARHAPKIRAAAPITDPGAGPDPDNEEPCI